MHRRFIKKKEDFARNKLVIQMGGLEKRKGSIMRENIKTIYETI